MRARAKQDWDNYVRKWHTAETLFAHAANDLQIASTQFDHWKTEEAKTLIEISVAKTSLLKFIELALSAGGKILLHDLAGLLGLFTTYEWIRWDVYPAIRDRDQAMKDAAKEVDAAVKLAQEAIADMNRALDAEKACKDQWAKDDAERQRQQALLDKARQLRESWALDGSALYKDPNDPNAYPMDAGAALQRAIKVLSSSPKGKQGSTGKQAASALRGWNTTQFIQVLTVSLAGTAAQHAGQSGQGANEIYTVEQMNLALQEIEHAEQLMRSGHDMVEKQKAFEDNWGSNLKSLDTQWKESTPQPR